MEDDESKGKRVVRDDRCYSGLSTVCGELECIVWRKGVTGRMGIDAGKFGVSYYILCELTRKRIERFKTWKKRI